MFTNEMFNNETFPTLDIILIVFTFGLLFCPFIFIRNLIKIRSA